MPKSLHDFSLAELENIQVIDLLQVVCKSDELSKLFTEIVSWDIVIKLLQNYIIVFLSALSFTVFIFSFKMICPSTISMPHNSIMICITSAELLLCPWDSKSKDTTFRAGLFTLRITFHFQVVSFLNIPENGHGREENGWGSWSSLLNYHIKVHFLSSDDVIFEMVETTRTWSMY